MNDLINRQAAIDVVKRLMGDSELSRTVQTGLHILPSAQPEIVRCKDCKHWRQQTNYQGVLLSFGFCENEEMWRSLYGETYEVAHIDTDDDHYCGYAERRTDAKTEV